MQGKIPHFVEEQGALIGQFDLPDFAVLVRAGEGPGHVAEDFRLEQLLRDGRAVDADEGAVGPVARHVDCAGRQFFAGSGRAEDEDRRFGPRVAQQVGLERRDGGAVAEDGIDGMACPEGALDAPGVGIDLLVEEIHALEQCLHLFRGIEQGQGERADDVPVLVAERDAVDEDLPFAALYAPPCAEFRLAGSDDRRDAGIGDEIRNVAAHGIFRADAQVIGVGVVDEPDDAVPVADEQPRGQAAHGQFEEVAL